MRILDHLAHLAHASSLKASYRDPDLDPGPCGGMASSGPRLNKHPSVRPYAHFSVSSLLVLPPRWCLTSGPGPPVRFPKERLWLSARVLTLCCFKITLPRIFGCNAAVVEYGEVSRRCLGFQIPVGSSLKSRGFRHAIPHAFRGASGFRDSDQ